jgi:CelD/BcsL family acetyltransferase involved in cellulose biosynthesis
MRSTIINDLRGLVDVEGAWSELRDRKGMATPNTDPRIFAATARAMRETSAPHVALFHDGSGPRAIVIGRRSRRRLRCRLGYVHLRSPRLRCLDVVYGGLITDGSDEAKDAVRDHLRKLLTAQRVDHIMINHLPVEHDLFAALTDRHAFPSACLDGDRERHWRFVMADGPFENTLQRFSRKHRYNIRRADRLLVEHFDRDVTLRCAAAPREVGTFLAEAVRITDAGYQGAIGAGIGNPAVQQHLLDAAATNGRWRGYLLLGRGAPVAYQSGVICRNVFYLQSTGFRPGFARFSPGQVLLVRVLAELCAEGVRTVDYGFGDARYKRIYGNECREEVTILMLSDTLPAISARFVRQGAALAGRAATTLAAHLGLHDKIRRSWRRRLERESETSAESRSVP